MTERTPDPFARMLLFLNRLEESHIAYRLEHVRESLIVVVVVPGERWEIEFFPDGHQEIEVFRSTGAISHDEALLGELLTKHGS